jgi:hypothetical protein
MEEQILEDANEQPTVSIRRLEARTSICHAFFFLLRTLQEHQLYRYRIQCAQEILPHDAPDYFINGFCNICPKNPRLQLSYFRLFNERIIMTGMSIFTRNLWGQKKSSRYLITSNNSPPSIWDGILDE